VNISLDSNINIEKFSKDEVLFKEGDLPEAFYLVLSGKVCCLKWHNERLSVVYTAVEQDIIGEDCVFADDNQYFYSAVVLEDCELIRIEKSEVFSYLNEQSQWIKNILNNISTKIQHTAEVIAEHRIEDDKLLANTSIDEEQEAKFRSLL